MRALKDEHRHLGMSPFSRRREHRAVARDARFNQFVHAQSDAVHRKPSRTREGCDGSAVARARPPARFMVTSHSTSKRPPRARNFEVKPGRLGARQVAPRQPGYCALTSQRERRSVRRRRGAIFASRARCSSKRPFLATAGASTPRSQGKSARPQRAHPRRRALTSSDASSARLGRSAVGGRPQPSRAGRTPPCGRPPPPLGSAVAALPRMGSRPPAAGRAPSTPSSRRRRLQPRPASSAVATPHRRARAHDGMLMRHHDQLGGVSRATRTRRSWARTPASWHGRLRLRPRRRQGEGVLSEGRVQAPRSRQQGGRGFRGRLVLDVFNAERRRGRHRHRTSSTTPSIVARVGAGNPPRTAGAIASASARTSSSS